MGTTGPLADGVQLALPTTGGRFDGVGTDDTLAAMPSGSNLDWLRRKRGRILIFAFIASTLIEAILHAHARPDVLWMSMVAISMYLAFEVGLLFARFLFKR